MQPDVRPSAAEVAATALSGLGRARLSRAGLPEVDVLHARATDSSVVLLAGAADLRALDLYPGAGDDGVAARLDVTCCAPLPDLTVPRAVVHATGTARVATATEALPLLRSTCLGTDFGAAFRAWPQARLAVLDVETLDLHWSFGCDRLDPADVAGAAHDPLAAGEAEALVRVGVELGDRLVPLVRAMAHAHGGRTTVSLAEVDAVRPVGLDRLGVVLRCEGAVRHDTPEPETATIRLAFPAPVRDVDAALDALALMALTARSCAGRCPYA